MYISRRRGCVREFVCAFVRVCVCVEYNPNLLCNKLCFCLHIVQLHFLKFHAVSYYDDSLKIYDGDDASAPMLYTYNTQPSISISTRRSLPDDVRSSGNTLFVYFKTGYGRRNVELSIYYSAIIPVDGI